MKTATSLKPKPEPTMAALIALHRAPNFDGNR
jgi:hypothetical protein